MDREPLVYDFDLLVDSLKTARLIRDWVSQLEIRFSVQVGVVKVCSEDRVYYNLNLESSHDIIPIQLPDSVHKAYLSKGFAQTEGEECAFDLTVDAFDVIQMLEKGNAIADEFISVLKDRFRLMLDGNNSDSN